ncbi:DUF3052 domain-containing protein [Hyphobacterium sp.]|uniref:DUF3052 domain-containing protein n=1 Tax=Hyphobacterium sp. TaxID=2004662 RepID=UPI003BA99DD2
MTYTVGYSGTPLPKKLGLKDGQAVCFINLPENLFWLNEAAEFIDLSDAPEPGGELDVVHLFVMSKDQMNSALPQARLAIAQTGMVWVSWPKKASRVVTDMSEDAIREAAFPLDLVDIKVCAVDELWSGLKLVIRKDKRLG